jgi:hypothetical protein
MLTIDKKTTKLLKILTKNHNCTVDQAHKKDTLTIKSPKGEQYILHVNHSKGEKAYHPLRRWANHNFSLSIQ